MHDRLLLQCTRHLSDFHQKEKEGSQEREIRKETKDQEDQAGTRRKDISRSPPGCRKWENVEVQVLEEGEIFDPHAFLDGLAQQWHSLPPSTPQTSTKPQTSTL